MTKTKKILTMNLIQPLGENGSKSHTKTGTLYQIAVLMGKDYKRLSKYYFRIVACSIFFAIVFFIHQIYVKNLAFNLFFLTILVVTLCSKLAIDSLDEDRMLNMRMKFKSSTILKV